MTFSNMRISCRGNVVRLYSVEASATSRYLKGAAEIDGYTIKIIDEIGTIHEMDDVSPFEIEVSNNGGA